MKICEKFTINEKSYFRKLLKQSCGGALQKVVFLEILTNSQQKTCATVSFITKVAGWRLDTCNFIKKIL